MVLSWLSWRWTSSHRSFAAVLLVSTLIITLRALVRPPSFTTTRPFEIYLDFVTTDAGNTPARRPLGTHTVADGLLVVNPDGPHPIFQLIRDAEAAWEAKRARASTTLDEAVQEYRRRYRRAPPLGFDKWWDYVVQHRVQLPDEYDEIYDDLEHFWGIDPAELARTQAALENQPGVLTVAKIEGQAHLKVVGSTLPQERPTLRGTIDKILTLLNDVAEDLPPLRFTLSPYDNPGKVTDWRVKNMAREAAANGTTLTSSDLPEVAKRGWAQACPPDSPARQSLPESFYPSPESTPPLLPSSSKTFIASHREAMDPCAHPSLLSTHGQFLSFKYGPMPERTLVPQFSLCSTMLHHDIRPPIPYGWEWELDPDPYQDDDEDKDGAYKGDFPWRHKVDERLGWRGRTTGMWASWDTSWGHGHRARLVTLASALEGNVSVLGVPEPEDADEVPVREPQTMRLAQVNPAWMDMAFTDKPVGCNEEAGTCNEMEKLWEFRRVQRRHEEGRYKFILDIDGNGWSGRFKRLITSHALVFKATVYPEWYASRIVPWVHYVPIQISYADLYDTLAFFRVHDALAARIAKAGREWSRRYWRREDMTAYFYRLLLEYARVTSLDRASMDYVG